MQQARTVFATIRNADDQLGQDPWTDYHRKFVALIRHRAQEVLAELVAPFGAKTQAATVKFEIAEADVTLLQHDLSTLAAEYGQDGLDWDYAKPKRLGARRRDPHEH